MPTILAEKKTVFSQLDKKHTIQKSQSNDCETNPSRVSLAIDVRLKRATKKTE